MKEVRNSLKGVDSDQATSVDGGGGDKKSACQYYRRVMSGERWVMRVVGGL